MTDSLPPDQDPASGQEKIAIRRGIPSDGVPPDPVSVKDRRGRPVYLNQQKKKVPSWLAAFLVFFALMAGLFLVVPRLTDQDIDYGGIPSGEDTLSTDWEGLLNSEETAVVSVSSAPLFSGTERDAVRVGEALFNEAVTMLDTRDRSLIKVRLSDGVTGFIQREHLKAGTYSLSPEGAVAKVVVRISSKRVMSHASQGALLVEAPMGTVLYADYRNGDLLRVRLPDMTTGWINISGVILLPPLASISVDENIRQVFVATLMGFYNSPLVPGGVTTRGISMEGALHVAGLLNGIDLPRDPLRLMEMGEPVSLPAAEEGITDLSLMEEGDLAFFSSKTDPETIQAMAVRVSDGQLLAALPSRSVLTLIDQESTQAQDLASRVLTVRRFDFLP